ALVSVKRSTAVTPGVRPNTERVTVAFSITTATSADAAMASQPDEIGDPDRLLLIDAVADRDAGQAGHRPRPRVGQLHVFGGVGLFEDQIAHAIVAAAVPGGQLRHRHLGPFAEAPGDVDLVAVGDLPRLPLERLHV